MANTRGTPSALAPKPYFYFEASVYPPNRLPETAFGATLQILIFSPPLIR